MRTFGVALHAPKRATLHVRRDDEPDALRDEVNAFFAAGGGEWEVRVQLAIDHEHTPIENASDAWPEARTPYLPVSSRRASGSNAP